MTDQELQKLQKLCDAADPGPWEITSSDGRKDEFYGYWHDVGPYSLSGKEIDDNDLFIQAAREAMPKLLKMVQEQKEWMARFSQDSEAYKQGRKDAAKTILKSRTGPPPQTDRDYLVLLITLLEKEEEGNNNG